MTPSEVFSFVENQLLDCPRAKMRIICSETLEEYAVEEVYESEWELFITIKPKEQDEHR